MMSLKQQMQSYGAYHKDPRNKLTHFVGVPLVTFSLFLVLGWFRFVRPEVPITAATLFYLGVVIYYLRLDWSVALMQLPVTLTLLMVSDWVAQAAVRLVLLGIPGHIRAGLDHPARRPRDRGPASGAGRQHPPGLQRALILDHRGAGGAEAPQGSVRVGGSAAELWGSERSGLSTRIRSHRITTRTGTPATRGSGPRR